MKREKYELLTADNAMLLLVDNQDGMMSWTNTLPLRDLKRNTLLLTRAAKAIGMPMIMTTSMETEAQGPLMHELQDIVPDIYDNRIKREGIALSMHLWILLLKKKLKIQHAAVLLLRELRLRYV